MLKAVLYLVLYVVFGVFVAIYNLYKAAQYAKNPYLNNAEQITTEKQKEAFVKSLEGKQNDIPSRIFTEADSQDNLKRSFINNNLDYQKKSAILGIN